MPFGGPTHERLAQVDDASPQTTSSGDVWAQRQHGTCNANANATGFERALTYSPPFFVRAHQTTKEDCTPGTLKARQVALVEPVAYLKDLVTGLLPLRGKEILAWNRQAALQTQPASPGNEQGKEPSQAYRQSLPHHADATYVNLGTLYRSPARRRAACAQCGTRGGAFIVVRGWESQPHGEGR